MEQPIVDSARGMGDQAENGAGAEEGREKREQEIKAKFGGVAKSLSARRDFQVRWTTRRTGMPCRFQRDFRGKRETMSQMRTWRGLGEEAFRVL